MHLDLHPRNRPPPLPPIQTTVCVCAGYAAVTLYVLRFYNLHLSLDVTRADR